MKKHFLTFLCILATATGLIAQTQKGNQLLGGSIGGGLSKGTSDYYYQSAGYMSNATSTVKINTFYVGPNYSYFVANNLDLGISAGFGTAKTAYNYSSYNNYVGLTEASSRLYSVSVNLRKYFLYNQKLGIRTGPYASYQYNSNRYTYLNSSSSDPNSTSRTVNAGIGLDLIYFPTHRLGIASALGSLAYNHNSTTGNYSRDKLDGLSLSLTSALNLSVFYCFGK